jgi:hypothetical protein
MPYNAQIHLENNVRQKNAHKFEVSIQKNFKKMYPTHN